MMISTHFLPRVMQGLKPEDVPTMSDEKGLKKKLANIGKTREEPVPLMRRAATTAGNRAWVRAVNILRHIQRRLTIMA